MVVISIIGLLSSIVLAALNGARKKAQDAAIIADLHGFMAEAEFSRSDTANYSYINNVPFADKIKTGITKISGANAVSCTSAGGSGSESIMGYLPTIWKNTYGENHTRWACSATNSDKSIVWSVSSDSNRVVTWDKSDVVPDGTNKTWSEAIDRCAIGGGRTPTLEELYTAIKIVGVYDNVTATAGFSANLYWSNTSSVNYPAEAFLARNGGTDVDVYNDNKTDRYNVRCIR